MSSGMQIAGLLVLAAVLVMIAIRVILRVRNNPEKKERERRRILHERGRLGEAMVTEVSENLIQYQYLLQGVQYMASQDVCTLTEFLPPSVERLVGTVGMKYSTRNPANSIVICEEWSGLRTPAPLSSAANIDVSANADPLTNINMEGAQAEDSTAA
jgi:hypothetical protein